MPRQGEKARKIKQLESGHGVRPPNNWWREMMPIIRREYPWKDKSERSQVLGGIWSNYDVPTKERIIREYQTNRIRRNKRP
jgi:hypothetical protein